MKVFPDEEVFQSLAPEFFYDEKVLLSFGTTKSIDQAKGHLILLGSNVENFLKLATLIDGSTVDFLFGVRYASEISTTGRSRSNEVKKFIRSLDTQGQDAASEFYFSMYNAVVEYHHDCNQCCSFIAAEKNKRDFFEKIDRAFTLFRKRIKPSFKQ
jgi:hypothetical protein